MAYNGYLLKVNGTIFPMKFIAEKTYKVHPDQRLDIDSARDTTGVLHRSVVDHMPNKIEFTTIEITNKDVSEITRITGLARTNKPRDVMVELYNPETDEYSEALCYIPNLEYLIDWIDNENNVIHYSPIRYAFIEY